MKLYAGHEETEQDLEQQIGSKLGKEYIKTMCCHPAYLTYMQSLCMCAKSLQSCSTVCDPMDCSPPGFSVGFSREEYWSGLPCPPPGDPPDPGIDPPSLIHWQARSLPLAPPVNPICREHHVKCR